MHVEKKGKIKKVVGIIFGTLSVGGMNAVLYSLFSTVRLGTSSLASFFDKTGPLFVVLWVFVTLVWRELTPRGEDRRPWVIGTTVGTGLHAIALCLLLQRFQDQALFLVTSAAFLGLFALASSEHEIAAENQKPKPRVVVWTHNRVTMVTTEKAFNLAIAQENLIREAIGKEALPNPPFFVLFSASDHPLSGLYARSEYERLVKGCEVVEAKMFVHIPLDNQREHRQVPLATMWMLLHGSVPHDVVRMAELGATTV